VTWRKAIRFYYSNEPSKPPVFYSFWLRRDGTFSIEMREAVRYNYYNYPCSALAFLLPFLWQTSVVCTERREVFLYSYCNCPPNGRRHSLLSASIMTRAVKGERARDHLVSSLQLAISTTTVPSLLLPLRRATLSRSHVNSRAASL
jgi:hypothetical protein